MDFKLTKWRVEDIDFGAIKRELIADREDLFYLITIASFIEITSNLYAKNLVSKYSSQSEELAKWLDSVWEFEEVQHGRALKAYVNSVWSDFDWEAAYKGFFEEYAALCTPGVLRHSPGLEMIERATIETGTSTFYSFLSEVSDEPVLKGLSQNIKIDEVGHYKMFKHYFEEFNKSESNSKWDIFKTIIERIKEMESDDTYIAFKHIYMVKEGREFNKREFDSYNKNINVLMDRYYPYKMGAKMVLQLLYLGDLSERIVLPVMVYMAKKFLFK